MILADDEKAMPAGAEGPAVAAAMNLLVRYGATLGAERLCGPQRGRYSSERSAPAWTSRASAAFDTIS